jgi:KDO2-lipid IV(A) lauroyltransferase
MEVDLVHSWRRFRHRLELAGVRFLKRLPALLPFRAAVKLGGLLGRFAFDIVRIRRGVTLDNIAAAFGERYTAAERKSIGRRSYVNFAKSMVEFASLDRLDPGRFRSIVRMEGIEYLDTALERGKGAVVVTGHFGSWELLGAATVAYGYAVDFLVGEQSNRLVDQLMNDLRAAGGIGIIARGVAARGVFASLKKNRIVALLSDQDARRAGIFVDFLGRPASTFQGAAQFALRMESVILCCCIVRQPDESHIAFFLPPIHVDTGAEREGEIRRLTEEHTRLLARCVEDHPDHYFWAHRRWKTKPPAEAGGTEG